MFRDKLTAIEKSILLLVLLLVAAGFVLFYSNLSAFEWYVKEDSLVEWITVFGLLLGSFVSLGRFFKLFKFKNWWFLTVTFLLGLLLFFAAGEEISWGQRIFGIQSSEYFQKHNAQGETNLHNLVVNGVKINKLIFSLVLSIALGIYLIVVPLLHAKNKSMKNFLDRSGVPVARLYQVIAIILVFGLTALIPHGKNPEILEGGAALLFFLIVRYPANLYVFNRESSMLNNSRKH